MVALARCTLSATALLFIATSILAQSASTNSQPTGVVTGRVTINGQPTAGVILTLQSSGSGPPSPLPLKAVTNDDGRYQFTSVAAGRYTLAPFAAAFVPLSRNQFGQLGQTLTLAEGETAEGIDFTLTRGAVITGRIRDATGQPVIGEVVNITAVDASGQARSTPPNPSGNLVSQETDDRGVYRLYGLEPGTYVVAANPGGQSTASSSPYSGETPT